MPRSNSIDHSDDMPHRYYVTDIRNNQIVNECHISDSKDNNAKCFMMFTIYCTKNDWQLPVLIASRANSELKLEYKFTTQFVFKYNIVKAAWTSQFKFKLIPRKWAYWIIWF